jgi:hypothetical protein
VERAELQSAKDEAIADAIRAHAEAAHLIAGGTVDMTTKELDEMRVCVG